MSMGERRAGDEGENDWMTEGKDVEEEEEMKLMQKKSYSQRIRCFEITNRLVIAVLVVC